jgi:hypothetical protein
LPFSGPFQLRRRKVALVAIGRKRLFGDTVDAFSPGPFKSRINLMEHWVASPAS